MTPHMNSEIRTPNVSDGFNPSPERERRVNAEKQVPPAPIPTAEGAPSTSHTNNASPRAEQSDRANSSPGPGSRTPDPAFVPAPATTHRPAASTPLPETFFRRRTRHNAQPPPEVAPAHFRSAATPSAAA
jgi:hypothetical protein